MCGSVSRSVWVTFNGVVKVGGRGCLLSGIWLRVRGVCGTAASASLVDDCCCCWGSLYSARGEARNGVSGFGFVDDGCVVRPALSMGRRVRPLNIDRESMLNFNADFSGLVVVCLELRSREKNFMAQVAAWAAAVTCWEIR